MFMLLLSLAARFFYDSFPTTSNVINYGDIDVVVDCDDDDDDDDDDERMDNVDKRQLPPSSPKQQVIDSLLVVINKH